MISADFVIALVFIGIILAVVLSVNLMTRGMRTHEYGMLSANAIVRRGVNVIATISIILFIIGLYPYEREHHWYEPYTATIVSKESSTFNVNEDNEYLITLDNGVVFRSDDYRFVPLVVGDVISVNCIRNWSYTAQDDWDCRFAGANP